MNKFTSSIGMLAILGSSAAMAATLTVVPSDANPAAGQAFSLTVHVDGIDPVGAESGGTAGATLGLSIANPNVQYVSGQLPASGPFSVGAFYLPHPSTGTPATFDILAPSAGAAPSGNFDALILNFTSTAGASGAAGITLIDNQNTLAWFDSVSFNPIPMTYNQANVTIGTAVPAPAVAWLIAPAVLAAGRFSRRRKAA